MYILFKGWKAPVDENTKTEKKQKQTNKKTHKKHETCD